MRTTLLIACIIAISSIGAMAQTPRTVISSGGNRQFTVGQTFVSYSKGNPNRLWQGFWLPVSVPTGVTDFTPLVPFAKVYPNPASNNFNIESSTIITGGSIFDLQGNLVKEFTTQTVAVDDLNTGIYSVQIKTVDNKVEHHRLVIYR